jgi:hypothetical protein
MSNTKLTEDQIYTLNSLEQLGLRNQFAARQLLELVYKCRDQQTTEGLAEMVAFTFNAQQFTPKYGGGAEQLPPGKYTGVIVSAEPVNSTDDNGNVKGGYLALTLTPTEGALQGQKQIDRINLHHSNPKVVEIANEQMSAYCHVLNQFSIADTNQLCNIPFQFEIGWQKNNEPTQEKPNGGYTEVKAIYDINGNGPGKAGNGPAPQAAQQQPPAQPPANVAPAQGAQPQQPPAQQPQDGQQAWGNPAAPAQEAQQQPPAQQPPQGGWGGAPAQAAQPQAGGQPAPWGGPQQ